MSTYPALNYASRITPATRAKAEEILGALMASRGKSLTHVWGYDPNPGNPEHHTGRALDFMVFNDRAAGDFIADYVWRHRARLGLVHVIWRQRIISTRVSPGVWRQMGDRGSGTANHMDHPHVLFDSTPYRAASKPASSPSKPKPAPSKPAAKPSGSLLRRGSKGAAVRRLQSGLRKTFPAYAGRLSVDGDFGPATERVVREFQTRSGLRADGVVGPATRAALAKHGVRL